MDALLLGLEHRGGQPLVSHLPGATWRADYGGAPDYTMYLPTEKMLADLAQELGSVSRPIEVTLLTQVDCSFCDAAKEILTRVGREYPLQLREIDLATVEGQRLGASAGVLFAPGVLLDGEALSYGRLSERKLRRALERRASTRDEQARAT